LSHAGTDKVAKPRFESRRGVEYEHREDGGWFRGKNPRNNLVSAGHWLLIKSLKDSNQWPAEA